MIQGIVVFEMAFLGGALCAAGAVAIAAEAFRLALLFGALGLIVSSVAAFRAAKLSASARH